MKFRTVQDRPTAIPKAKKPMSAAKRAAWQKAVEAAAKKKREQTHCLMGHPLSGDNVYYKREKRHGHRVCKICCKMNAAINKRHWKAILESDPDHEKHGTTAGAGYGCKCLKCRKARSDYNRLRYYKEASAS